MATYTANYGLHQWVPGDNFLRTDFNTDFQKIDAGIKAALSTAQGKAEIVTGTYTGDGTQNRLINLGFQPRAVLIEKYSGDRGNTAQVHAGLTIQGGAMANRDGDAAAAIAQDGFNITYNATTGMNTNISGTTYYYLAVQ